MHIAADLTTTGNGAMRFTYYHHAPMNGCVELVGEYKEGTYDRVNMTMAEFVAAMAAAVDGRGDDA